ncbi:MAG: Mut7-C RNAse domain-containing protein [Candidatus Njordarchaeales archaeon]
MSPTKEIKFIVDEMLGNLARWLRILGFDTVYAQEIRKKENIRENKRFDTYIIRIALLEDRILVTRDTELYTRARYYGVKAILLYSNISDIVSTLYTILSKVNVKQLPIYSSSPRCPVCNGLLKQITEAKIRLLVPENSWQYSTEFYVCNSCGKVYWKGSHWRRISSVLAKISQLLKQANTH